MFELLLSLPRAWKNTDKLQQEKKKKTLQKNASVLHKSSCTFLHNETSPALGPVSEDRRGSGTRYFVTASIEPRVLAMASSQLESRDWLLTTAQNVSGSNVSINPCFASNYHRCRSGRKNVTGKMKMNDAHKPRSVFWIMGKGCVLGASSHEDAFEQMRQSVLTEDRVFGSWK